MTPQQSTYQDALNVAERDVQAMLGVSLDEGLRMLDAGELAGTAAESEMRMLRFLLRR